MRSLHLICLCAVLLAGLPAAAASLPDGMRVAASLPAKGGRLELLQDKRVTPERLTALQQLYFYGMAASPAIEALAEQGLVQDASLRLVGEDGAVRFERPLASPFAEVEGLEDNAGFIVAVTTGGFGQFNGTTGRLLAIDGGIFVERTAVDALSGRAEPIQLIRTQKSGWKVVGDDILHAGCDTEDHADDGYRESYTRYKRSGGVWTKSQRLARGYCNWSGFPVPSLFP